MLPASLEWIDKRLSVLRAYSAKGPENARRAKAAIFGLENAVKALNGRQVALQDSKAMAKKAAEENELRAKVGAEATLAKAVGDPWSTIAAVLQEGRSPRPGEAVRRASGARASSSSPARSCGWWRRSRSPTRCGSRSTSTRACPRSRTASTRRRRFTTTSKRRLSLTSSSWPKRRSARPIPSSKPCSGASPRPTSPRPVVAGTRLKDVEARKALVAGGSAAVEASTDPMIVLARRIDPLARAIRKLYEDEIDAPKHAGRAEDRAGAMEGLREDGITRCDLHPAAHLRHRPGLPRGRDGGPGAHDLLRSLRPVVLPRGQSALEPASPLARQEGAPRPRYSAQLRLHERHHRRQLRQPGREPRRRVRGDHLRREHPVAWAGTTSTPTRWAARSPWTPAASSRRCARSSTRTPW